MRTVACPKATEHRQYAKCRGMEQALHPCPEGFVSLSCCSLAPHFAGHPCVGVNARDFGHLVLYSKGAGTAGFPGADVVSVLV